MKIALGSDHAGFNLKSFIKKALISEGHDVIDVGCDSLDPVDYPDYAFMVSKRVVSRAADRGIVICGSGVGACIAANKIKGIRASVCHDTYSGHQGVEHDDMNVLVLGARIVGEALALEIALSFLNARFSNEERHVRRLQKILQAEG